MTRFLRYPPPDMNAKNDLPVPTDLCEIIGLIDRHFTEEGIGMIPGILTIVLGHAALSARASNTVPALLHALEHCSGVTTREVREWTFGGAPVSPDKRLGTLAVLKRFARNLYAETRNPALREHGRYAAAPAALDA